MPGGRRRKMSERGKKLRKMAMDIKVPRTRKGGLRSKLLPQRWKKNEEAGEKLLRVLLSMGYARGTAKTVLSQPGLKAGDIEAIYTSHVDESAAFVYLDGRRV